MSVFIHFIPGVPILLLLSLLLRRWLPRTGDALALFFCVVLIAGSFPPVIKSVVRPLENQYPVLPEAPGDTRLILVHGFGHIVSRDLPINSALYPVALARLTEGVRLWKTQPESVLAVSGAPPVPGTISHAEMMYKMARALGVPDNHLLRFDQTLDTEHEINAAVEWLNSNVARANAASAKTAIAKTAIANTGINSRLVVVSTAMHLPRSALMLEDHDVLYSMAPTEFTISDSGVALPSAYALLTLDRAIHEWVGMAWYRIKRLSL